MPPADPTAAIAGSLTFFAFLILAARLARGSRSVTLVAQKFHLSVAPQPSRQPSVEIVGRAAGLVAFVLSLMGFSPITRFIVAGSELRCQRSSLWGENSQFIPLRAISSLSGGVKKPILALVIATIMMLSGIGFSVGAGSWIPVVSAAGVAIVCLIYYALAKRFFLAVYPHGGPPIELVFTPNVIEGVAINSEQTVAVIGVIRDLILSQGGTVPAIPSLVASTVPEAPDLEHVAAMATPIENHPQFWSEMEPAEIEPLEPEPADDEEVAGELYTRAKALAQNGDQQKAIVALKDILRRYPATEAAQKARRNLERVGAM